MLHCPNWAELDEEDTFRKTFEEVHGANAWFGFNHSMNEVWENSFDEIWEYQAELAGNKDN